MSDAGGEGVSTVRFGVFVQSNGTESTGSFWPAKPAGIHQVGTARSASSPCLPRVAVSHGARDGLTQADEAPTGVFYLPLPLCKRKRAICSYRRTVCCSAYCEARYYWREIQVTDID